MFHPKQYLQFLFGTLFLIGTLAAGYMYDFSKKFPPPITNRISFDAKLKFVREHIDPDQIDTIIVGSSIGLNNVIGSKLEDYSEKVHHALNLSVYEATTLEAEQILELAEAFPNVKRIIYSVQYSDLPHAKRYDNYNPEILRKFMRNELSPVALSQLLFNACNNIPFCVEREKKWKNEHMQSDKFTYLGFDHTGSVPLKIYKGKGVGGRWYLPHPGIMHPESFHAIARMAAKARKNGIEFYVAHQPYRPELYSKHKSVRDAIKYFDDKIMSIVSKHGGVLIQLQKLPLNDYQFADRTHLNDKGAALATKEIARTIDKHEKTNKTQGK